MASDLSQRNNLSVDSEGRNRSRPFLAEEENCLPCKAAGFMRLHHEAIQESILSWLQVMHYVFEQSVGGAYNESLGSLESSCLAR